MSTLKEILHCTLLVALCVLVFVATVAVARLPAIIDARIAIESEAFRTELRGIAGNGYGILDHHAAALRADVIREVAAARRDAHRELAATLDTLDHRVVWAQKDISGQINGAIGRADVHVGHAIERWVMLADAYAELPVTVGERLDPWTECKGNGACWQAQFTGALGSGRATMAEASRTMRAIREATPEIVENANKATANVAAKTEGGLIKTIWRMIW